VLISYAKHFAKNADNVSRKKLRKPNRPKRNRADEPQYESRPGRNDVRPGLLKSHGHAIASFPRNESGASADEQLRESGTHCDVAGVLAAASERRSICC